MFDRNRHYWVVTNENEIQNMIKYSDGLVEYHDMMYPNECHTGIVFAGDDIFSCVTEYTKYIRTAYIPEDANVMQLNCSDEYGQPITLFKTNKIILDPRRDFDEVTVRELIEEYNVNKDVSYSKVLHHFCELEDVSTVKYLLRVGVNVNYPSFKHHPIITALKTGNQTLFRLIYKKMRDNTKNPTYMKDLATNVVAYGTPRMLSYMVHRGLIPIIRKTTTSTDEEFQKRLIQQACVSGRCDMLKYLIEKLKIRPTAFYNESLVFAVMSKEENIDVIEYLLSKKVNIHSNDDKAFRLAVEKNRYMTTKVLVEHGANYHVYGNIALLISYRNEYHEIFEYLAKLDESNRLLAESIDDNDDVLYTL